jgi:two-component system sensor histidine kinase UhpB
MSLRVRVVVAIALVLFFSSAVGTALAGWQARQSLREELAQALIGGRQTVQSVFEDLPRSGHSARDLSQLVSTFDGNRHLTAALIGADGRRLFISHPLPVRAAPAWFAALFHPAVEPVALAVPAPGYRALELAPVYVNDVAAVWAEFIDLAMVLTASFIVGSALVWLTVGRALRPLSDFSAAFVRIGSGDYAATVKEEGPLELARVGAGVNEMARRLAAMQARNLGLEDQLITLADEERADLARDLHDEIGPHLFAVNVDAAMVAQRIAAGEGEAALGEVKSIQASVGHMQRLVREILGRLRPTQLIELGLAAAIDDLVAFWRARHPHIRFAVALPSDETAIAESMHETLYRVVQEGLNNAVRHGKPTAIEVEITVAGGGEVSARVTDDGVVAPGPREGGLGLIGMRERVAAAQGRLVIDKARPGGGWSVTARLPAPVEGGETGAGPSP